MPCSNQALKCLNVTQQLLPWLRHIPSSNTTSNVLWSHDGHDDRSRAIVSSAWGSVHAVRCCASTCLEKKKQIFVFCIVAIIACAIFLVLIKHPVKLLTLVLCLIRFFANDLRMTDIMDALDTDPINLLRGVPHPSLLPADLLRDAANEVLKERSIYTDALVYGPDPGYEPLRESIAQWLTRFYLPGAGAVTAKRICITGGASQNLGCMLSVFTDPAYTRNIWIVAPAYFLAFRIFEDAGFAGRMRAVPEDEEGVDIDALRRGIRRSEECARRDGADRPKYKPERGRAKVYKHVIYCVPTFANPSSRTMTLGRRRELVRLAREYDALVVCDDVYDFLQWPAEVKDASNSPVDPLKTAHLPRVVDIDRELDGGAERADADGFGNVCSNGSFSKIVAPGVRVGWIEGSEKLAYGVSQTGTTCSGGAPSQLTSTYLHMLARGPRSKLEEHIRNTLLSAYAARYKNLMNAIETHLLPLGFTLPQVDRSVVGGFFMWLGLPEALKADPFAASCRTQANTIIAPGSMFEVPEDDSVKFERSIRLCWAWEDEKKLAEGVEAIGSVAKKMLDEVESGDFVVVDKHGAGEEVAGYK